MGFVSQFEKTMSFNQLKIRSEFILFPTIHEVRTDLGLKPFAADRFLPSAVVGPVLIPP